MEECNKWSFAIDLTRDSGQARDTGDSLSETPVKQTFKKRKQEDLDDCDDDMERKRLLANCQERARMHKINKALEDLRKCLPQQFNIYHRRMSKIRTLRLAMSYINDLAELIRQDDIRRHGEHVRETFSRAQLDIPMQTMVGISSMAREAPPMLEMPSTVIPYYPYLREACSGYTAIESMYRTPDQPQAHHQSVYAPRHLDFGIPTSQGDQTPNHPETIIAGDVCTPVKHRSTKRLFKRQGIMTPENVHGNLRPEKLTLTSPLLGLRYPAELNASLVSTASFEGEPADDGALEPGQIPSRGHAGRTLADIIDED